MQTDDAGRQSGRHVSYSRYTRRQSSKGEAGAHRKFKSLHRCTVVGALALAYLWQTKMTGRWPTPAAASFSISCATVCWKGSDSPCRQAAERGGQAGRVAGQQAERGGRATQEAYPGKHQGGGSSTAPFSMQHSTATRTSQPLAGAAYSRDSRRASGSSLATQAAGQQTERSRDSRACGTGGTGVQYRRGK